MGVIARIIVPPDGEHILPREVGMVHIEAGIDDGDHYRRISGGNGMGTGSTGKIQFIAQVGIIVGFGVRTFFRAGTLDLVIVLVFNGREQSGSGQGSFQLGPVTVQVDLIAVVKWWWCFVK